MHADEKIPFLAESYVGYACPYVGYIAKQEHTVGYITTNLH